MDDIKQIYESIKGLCDSYKKGDLEGILDYYSDSIFRLSSQSPCEDKTEIARSIATDLAENDISFEVIVDEVRASGNLAAVCGSSRVKLKPKPSGKSLTIERRFIDVWQKENGFWKVRLMMNNHGPSENVVAASAT